MTAVPRLLFSVPRGFEDVAARDIQRFCPAEPSATGARHDTGTVALSWNSLDDLQACLGVYNEGHLWAVQRCMLEMGPLFDLPEELCDQLDVERKELPSKRSRSLKQQPGNKHNYIIRVEPLANKQVTPGEKRLSELLNEMIEKRRADLWQALQLRSAFRNSPEICPSSFAVRFDRREFLLPTMTSKDMARESGGAVYGLLGDFSHREKQTVDLESPELEVHLTIMPGSARYRGHVSYAMALPSPAQGPSHRTFDRVHGRTSLQPARAYCLCLVHPDLAEGTRLSSDTFSRVFLDPCGGLGSIPIELAAIARRDRLRISCLSSDIETPSVQGGVTNCKAAGLGPSYGLAGIDAGIVVDGRGRGRSGGFRSGVIDGIVTDLPFGIRELTASATAVFYPLLLRTLATSMRQGSHAVFLTAKKKYFDRALAENASAWEGLSERPVNVEGIPAYAVICKRKEAI